MSDYDQSIHTDPRAAAWATLYCETFPEADRDLMMGWFANAMMAMHDWLHNGKIAELEAQLAEAREALRAVQAHDDSEQAKNWYSSELPGWLRDMVDEALAGQGGSHD